jgi:hypothetical protein
MTRWHPDTCGCEIEYDDDIKVVAIHKKCAKHGATADAVTHLDIVLSHNRRKNAVHNAVVEHLKTLGLDHDGVHTGYDEQDNLIVSNSKLGAADQQKVTTTVKPSLGTSALKFQG